MKPNVWSRSVQSKKTLHAPAAAGLLQSPFWRLWALVCVGLALALLDRYALQPRSCSCGGQAAEGTRSQSKQGSPLQTPCCTIPCEKSAQQAVGSWYAWGMLSGSLLNAVPVWTSGQGSCMLDALQKSFGRHCDAKNLTRCEALNILLHCKGWTGRLMPF